MSTTVVQGADRADTGRGPDHTVADVLAWLSTTSLTWRKAIRYVAIDMSAIYRSAIRTGLPEATVVVDHFHVVQLANKMRPGDEALDLTTLARRVRTELAEACAAARLPVPRLIIEPGRAIAGPAGIALHHVLAVKRTGDQLFVAVDGGMSDNPRPALYGVRYAPRLIGRHSTADPARVTVVGRHCEAGDILAAEVELPDDVRPGDLLAVPVSGAYHLSMASGYNLVGRPPVAAVRDGHARLLVRRESPDDIRSRDVGL
ncbi:transposase [Streptomyces sp. NBC_01478]|uniref:transposase n=1 Tax=Streptomyces sp. NBC_01478 TaxID=2903882 RepID=UPI002E3605D1|nr:transposase [Streptomyces sp. NBC_01478]